MDLAVGLEPLHSIGRVEDGPLLRGAGRFVDDIELPRMLHIAFVRSPIAHAVIRGIEVLAAQNLPGVRAVLKYADLRPLLTRDRIALAMPSSAIRFHVDPPVLASDETCYVGEPIALVVAESRSAAFATTSSSATPSHSTRTCSRNRLSIQTALTSFRTGPGTPKAGAP
jgi:CO/xanthine dehydrogenase Mo-binding subunit